MRFQLLSGLLIDEDAGTAVKSALHVTTLPIPTTYSQSQGGF